MKNMEILIQDIILENQRVLKMKPALKSFIWNPKKILKQKKDLN